MLLSIMKKLPVFKAEVEAVAVEAVIRVTKIVRADNPEEIKISADYTKLKCQMTNF